jgi:hypothetical protein
MAERPETVLTATSLTTIGDQGGLPPRRCSSRAVASRHAQIRSRTDRLSGNEHLEIYVRADRNPGPSNNSELLACRDGSFALSKRWGDHAQMAVDSDEAIVLHQDF